MAASELDTIWSTAYPDKSRPEVYTSPDYDEDGFRPLADPLDFIADISKLSTSQMYAQAANNQYALQQAQEEYLELEKIINQLKSKDLTVSASTKNPQILPDTREFEERKESVLYGYKYDPNKAPAVYGRWSDISEQERRDLRGYQDPFAQGGFVPNDRQLKGLFNRAKDKRNPDGWTPIERDGKKLIPRMAARVSERDEYVALSGQLALVKGAASKPVTRSGTPVLESIDLGGRDTPVNKRLRNTRFNGAKVPLTRDVSEAPSLPASRASTPKRKRGDTPLVSLDQNGSPIKRPKLTVSDADVQMPPRRKHHNQYTKAKEKAALEAMTVQKTQNEPEAMSIDSNLASQASIAESIDHGNYPWAGLTDQEKRDFHWNNDTLLLAVKEDPTWLNEDPKTQQKWTKKIIESKYPVRTYSMYKKWDYWRLMGEDKRPRNKKKSNSRTLDEDDEPDMDEASEIATATATPSPLSRSFAMHDVEDARGAEERRLFQHGNGLGYPPRGFNKFSRNGLPTLEYMFQERDLQARVANARKLRLSEERRTSGSDSASQTISVNRDDAPSETGRARRTTRALRKNSSQG